MKARVFEMTILAATVLLGCLVSTPTVRAIGGQKEPSTAVTATPSPDSSTPKTKEKAKHLSGNLVDVGCMAKALSPQAAPPSSSASPASPAPYTPHFTGAAEPSPQAGQTPGGAGTSPNMGSGNPSGPPGQQYPTMDTSAQDQQRAAEQARLDNAMKQCAATPATQNFGLAMTDGQVMQFDAEGNTKASEAMKATTVEPGKKVKAKVAGTMENKTTVDVASVDIKAAKGKTTP